jgi:hypothetical protein
MPAESPRSRRRTANAAERTRLRTASAFFASADLDRRVT